MFNKAYTTGIFHDAETGMFEACVTLEDDTQTSFHVVNIPGHIATPFEFLRPALIKAAKVQRNEGRFYSQVTREQSQSARAHDAVFARPSLLDHLLGRAA